MQPSGARLDRSHSVLAMAVPLECCAAGSGDTANWAMLAGAKPMRVKAATRSWRALSNTALGAPEWAWLSPDTTRTAHLEKSAACTATVSDSRKPKQNRKRLILQTRLNFRPVCGDPGNWSIANAASLGERLD